MQPVAAPTRAASLRANCAVEILDYLRVPYGSTGTSASRPTCTSVAAGAAHVCWPRFSSEQPAGAWHLGDVRLFGRLLDDDAAEGLLGPGWSLAEAVNDPEGVARAHLRRSADGSVFLPFDPDEAVHLIRSEQYLPLTTSAVASGATRLARTLYYRVRPFLPRPVQIAMRRGFTSVQHRSAFPRWPLETSLHDLLDFVLRVLGEAAGAPVPWIAPWPAGYGPPRADARRRAAGRLRQHPPARDLELEHGFRSSWNLVPRRYAVSDDVVAELTRRGFESASTASTTTAATSSARMLRLASPRCASGPSAGTQWGSARRPRTAPGS